MLLQLINANADISFLLKNGYSYSQISALFGKAMADGLVFHDDSLLDGPRFVVTTKGAAVLSSKKGGAEFGKQGMWISPDERNKRPSMKLDDVFLPKVKQSYF